MSESKINGGIYIVLFLMWGIISIAAVYKVIEGIVDDKLEPLYIIITSINTFILLILGILHICNLYDKPKIQEDNRMGNIINV